MFFRAYFWSSLFAVALCSSSAFGGLLSARGGAGLPIRIKADSLNYYDTIRTYSARGNVVITWGDQSLWADAVDLNTQTMKTVAWGNPRFTSGEDWFTGTRVEIDLGAGTGTLYDGTLFIKESHFYVKGNKIEKIGEDTYHICTVPGLSRESKTSDGPARAPDFLFQSQRL
jgi:LPS-assembly protein